MPQLNLLVIRTQHPEALKTQYEQLGFQFQYHKHDKGPFHYAHEEEDFVFEIYPLKKGQETADSSLRMGFTIEELENTLTKLRQTKWRIISEARNSEWGKFAIIQDLDGRKVELKESFFCEST
ncbi:MAG: VOC family protein [Bacteroidota bacterium]